MRGFRVKWAVGLAVALGVLVAGSVPAAHAILQRVGPVSNAPSVGGFPAWYQDTTGLALEFCDPKNQAELDGGWCLLLPGDPPVVPEIFPDQFFDEHFWFAANATMPLGNGGSAGLVLAVEAAFATAVQPGDQIAFSRIRMRLDPVPVTGTYRFIHPYGEEIFEAAVGERIFFTDDVGINCPPGGPFNCALASRLGPFLLPSATPGGPEMPPLTALNPTPDSDPAHFGGVFAPTAYPGNGKSYIADPARIGPVTGSPLGQNLFRIEGPAGSNLDGANHNFIETTDFSLMGRVFEGAIASEVRVDRASYARSAASRKVDVFANAFPATQARIPAGPAPAVVAPLLRFYDDACGATPAGVSTAPPAGTAVHAMASPGLMTPPQSAPASIYWGQSRPALIPPAVCVEHENSVAAGGQIVPVFFQANVTDQVFIASAAYDPANGGTLAVSATSSDELTPPVLTVAAFGDMVNGQFIVTPLAAPPAKVAVLSSFGGSNEFQVTTAVGAAGGGNIPVANGDTATVLEDSGPATIDVLANDTVNAGPIPAGAVVTIASPPLLGTAAVSSAGIVYTPNPNANGTDGFTYQVSVAGVSSNIAAVTVTVTPVNDAPVAANDTATAIINVPAAIDVLANDTDLDGAANLAAPVNVTLTGSPAGSIVTLSVTGRIVNFAANLAGAYTFTYQASDVAGAVSVNTATVTVTVAAGETVTIQQAEFRTTARRWRVTGVISPTTQGNVTISYADGPNAGFVVGTAPIAAGAWAFDVTGVTGLRDPRTGQASRIRVTGPAGGSATANISLRR